jgi:pimeloyl-ACP methyl ester carboxylesterase
VHVEECGAGAGRPIICIHGLGGGTHYFGAFGPALAHRHHIVALDLPGSGLSPLRSSGASSNASSVVSSGGSSGGSADVFSFDDAADVVVALAKRKQWDRVVIVGHSMGTIAGLEVIRRAPGLAAGFIAVGGLPEPLPGARQRIATRAAEIRRDGIIGRGAGVIAANVAARTREQRPDLVGVLAKLFDMQSADAYAATAEALAAWQARPLPPLEDVPCLVVTGDEDVYAPIEAARDFARTLPASTRFETIADCGHLPFLERPVPFADVVTRFLDAIGW